MMYFNVEDILDRAYKNALPKIYKHIEKNKAKDKHLKRVKNRNMLRGKKQ